MEIKNKTVFKAEMKKTINRYIREFPVCFFGNIMVNVAAIFIIIFALLFVETLIWNDYPKGIYGLVIIFLFALSVLPITVRGFLRNINVLQEIGKDKYKFGIEDYEMDLVVEFLEDLPMKKEEIEQIKVELSFDKLIDVLEAADIINCEKGVYNMNIIFKYRTKGIFGKGFF